jgi:hypothetical protein
MGEDPSARGLSVSGHGPLSSALAPTCTSAPRVSLAVSTDLTTETTRRLSLLGTRRRCRQPIPSFTSSNSTTCRWAVVCWYCWHCFEPCDSTLGNASGLFRGSPPRPVKWHDPAQGVCGAPRPSRLAGLTRSLLCADRRTRSMSLSQQHHDDRPPPCLAFPLMSALLLRKTQRPSASDWANQPCTMLQSSRRTHTLCACA